MLERRSSPCGDPCGQLSVYPRRAGGELKGSLGGGVPPRPSNPDPV